MVKYGALTLDTLDGEYIIAECDRSAREVEIPLMIDGVNVAEIADRAFFQCTSLVRVSFQERGVDGIISDRGLRVIGENAFSFCTALTEINIPDSVEAISHGAFYNCKGLRSVALSDKVYVGPYAFSHCSSLVEIPPLSVISEGVFEGCSSLTTAQIKDGITEISGSAFERCESITEVVIPSSVRRIEALAFRGCTSLKRVIFEKADGWLMSSGYHERSIPLDLSSPVQNAINLSRMDFDDGVLCWYR